MTLGLKKANEIMAVVGALRENGRTRLGIIQLHQIMRTYGVLEAYQRKEILLYLEAMKRIKIEGGIVRLLDIKNETQN